MDTIAEFQARRAEAWRRMRLSLAVMAIGFPSMFFVCSEKEDASALCVVVFALIAAAIVHVTLTWARFYRCPECEERVKDSEGGIPFNPKACANCGARLR